MEIICVKFNRGGDGYLHDSFCAYGYTYSVYPRNMIAPKEYIN